jgi:hypothetical protein
MGHPATFQTSSRRTGSQNPRPPAQGAGRAGHPARAKGLAFASFLILVPVDEPFGLDRDYIETAGNGPFFLRKFRAV